MSTTLKSQTSTAQIDNSTFDLSSWSATGTNDLPVGLMLEGAAVESAFMFLAGGDVASNGATAGTQVLRTIW